MSNILNRLHVAELSLIIPNGEGTKTGFALGSAYTYASAGAAYGFRFIAPVTGNLTDVWFFVTAIAGTPGVTTVELRNWNTVNNTRPGTTLHASQTITPGTTANKWINAHFSTPFSVTIGTPYWIVLGDAGWTTGNTATIEDVCGMSKFFQNLQIGNGYTAADGFATNPTAVNQPPALVLKFADGSLFGNPYTTHAGYTSNTLERGIKIVGLTEDISIAGVTFSSDSKISGLKIYKGTTAPGGTTEVTISFPTGAGAVGGCFFTPFKLLKNSIYRIVFTYSSSTVAPSYYQIENYTVNADITNVGLGGGTMYDTIDNGAGGWTDNIDRVPEMALLVSDQSVQPGALVNGGFLVEA